MSLHFWFRFWSLSRILLSLMRETHLCFWFTAKSRFLKVRECYFALLIPGKWEFWEEHVQTVRCLLQVIPGRKQPTVFDVDTGMRVWNRLTEHDLLHRYEYFFSPDDRMWTLQDQKIRYVSYVIRFTLATCQFCI